MAHERGEVLPLIPNASCLTDWRLNREVRFAARQRRSREWISFREIAQWLSELDGRGEPNEVARAHAYDMLSRDLLAGDFEEDGRSKVLYLHHRTPIARMTRRKLSDALVQHSTNIVRSEYLERCWIPRRKFDCWLAMHELPRSPARFKPQEPSRDQMSQSAPEPKSSKRRPGRKSHKRDAVASFIAEHYPGGVPGYISVKDLAKGLQNAKGIVVDARTVRRALGRK